MTRPQRPVSQASVLLAVQFLYFCHIFVRLACVPDFLGTAAPLLYRCTLHTACLAWLDPTHSLLVGTSRRVVELDAIACARTPPSFCPTSAECLPWPVPVALAATTLIRARTFRRSPTQDKTGRSCGHRNTAAIRRSVHTSEHLHSRSNCSECCLHITPLFLLVCPNVKMTKIVPYIWYIIIRVCPRYTGIPSGSHEILNRLKKTHLDGRRRNGTMLCLGSVGQTYY